MINCPACNQPHTVAQNLRYKEYHLRRCLDCGLMFWHPLCAPGVEIYDEWPLDFVGIRPVWSIQPAHARFLKQMPAAGGRLLDVGCGVGDFCYMAHKAGYTTTGIDFSHRFIESDRQRFPELDWEAMPLDEFVEKRGDKYDVVTFIQVLEHLDNLDGFLKLVKKTLRPNGYVACAVPNRTRWRFGSKLLREEWDYPPNHLTYWDSKSLARLFEDRGFRVKSMEVDRVRPFDCSFLLTEKLGLAKLGSKIGRKLVGRGEKTAPVAAGNAPSKPTAGRIGYRLYHGAFVPFAGVVTAPLTAILRKKGNDIYLLAQLEGPGT